MANALESDMTDQECIRRVLAEFIQLRDDKRFAEWVELFTEDGTFEYGSHHLVGRSAIRENVQALLRNDRGKHLCVNSIIDVSGDTASVSSDFLKVIRSTMGPGRPATGSGRWGATKTISCARAESGRSPKGGSTSCPPPTAPDLREPSRSRASAQVSAASSAVSSQAAPGSAPVLIGLVRRRPPSQTII